MSERLYTIDEIVNCLNKYVPYGDCAGICIFKDVSGCDQSQAPCKKYIKQWLKERLPK